MVGYGNMRTPTPSIEIANGDETAKSFAAFGQATYTPAALEALHILGGVRYTRDSKDAGGIFTRFGTGPASSLISGSDTWTATTYKVGLSYDLTQSSLLYANTSTGYKAGGFGYGPGTTSAGPIYAPEKIRAYEVGSKNRFFDNRLQVNVEGYYYKYQDYQTNLVLFSSTIPGPPVLTVSTAGRANYKGGAIDVQWAVTNADLLRVNFSRISAEYDSFNLSAPPGYTLVPGSTVTTTDLAGTDITGVPKWSGVASFEHTFRLSSGSLNAQLASNFRGPMKFSVNDVNGTANAAESAYAVASPTALEPGRKLITFGDDTSWAMFDFSLRYEPEAGDWAVTGYVHNIADKDHPNFGVYGSSTHLFTETFYPPRTYGVIFSIKLKGT
jgi:iron complex outermembrane receptor protein